MRSEKIAKFAGQRATYGEEQVHCGAFGPQTLLSVNKIRDNDYPHRSATLASLASRAASGDDAAFEKIHDRLNGSVERYFAQRIRQSDNVVNDLAQAVWIDVWRSLRNAVYDETRAALTTFIFAVAHKVLLRHLKKSPVSPPTDARIEDMPPDSDFDPAEVTHHAELIQAIRNCIFSDHDAIVPEERQLLVEIANGETERSLAARYGVSASTIHARKTAIFGRIRRHLARLGFSHESIERRGPHDV